MRQYFTRLAAGITLAFAPLIPGIWLYAIFPPEQLIILLVTWFVVQVMLARIPFFQQVFGSIPESMTGAAKWRVSIILIVFTWSIPTISVVQATSAGSRQAIQAMIAGGGIQGIPALLCILAVPSLTVLLPSHLKARGSKWSNGSHSPVWLANITAFVTAIYVVLLHFGGGALATLPTGAVYFAAFGVLVLLAPIYRAIINACWQFGGAVALDPWWWWRSWCDAYNEMRSKGTPTAAETPGEG